MILRNLLRAIRRQWMIALSLALGTLVLGTLLVPGAPLTFKARADVVLRESPFPSAPAEMPLTLSPWSHGKSLDFLRSDMVLEQAIRTDLASHYSSATPGRLADSIAALRSSLSIHREKGSDVFALTCTSTRPSRAVAAANAVARAFEAAATARLREEAAQALTLVDDALKVHARLQADLSVSLRAEGPVSADRAVEAEEQAYRRRLSELERSQAAARVECEALASQIEVLGRRIESGDVGPVSPMSTAESDRIARELEAARRDLEDLRATYPEDWPPVVRKAALLEQLRARRAQAMNREMLEARFAPLRELIEQLRQMTARRDEIERSIPAREAEIAEVRKGLQRRLASRPAPSGGTDEDRRRDLGTRVKALSESRRHIETLRARMAQEQDLARRIVERLEPARGATLSGSPLPILLAVGLVLGLAGALFRETTASTIRTEYDVRRYVNLPLLGIVPLTRGECDRTLLAGDPRAPLSEVFNTIAALVESRAKDESLKSVALVSAVPEEGKSTVACNLAIALARAGSRVLLVDADLRRATQHKLLSVPNEVGLSSYLQGAADAVDAAIAGTGVENLSLLPSGPLLDNPVPYLRSERFKAMVKDLRERFDYVLLDLPPVRSAADALLAAPLADGTILVLSARDARKDDATLAKRLLRSAKGKLMGCVLNKARVESRGYYYYVSSPADPQA